MRIAQHHLIRRPAAELHQLLQAGTPLDAPRRLGIAQVILLKALGEEYPRYGYLMLQGMLRTEGVVENPKRTYQLYRELGLQVRTKRRRKLNRPLVPMAVPSQPNKR